MYVLEFGASLISFFAEFSSKENRGPKEADPPSLAFARILRLNFIFDKSAV